MSVKTYNEKNFESEVLNSDKPVVVDFWAEWCPPCRALAPHIEELATNAGDKASVGKVDTDANQDLAAKYQIMNIPTVILFENGVEKQRIVGPTPEDLESLIK